MQATLALRFGGEGILKVKGIPFKATAADVRKFFNGYKIKPEGVSFIMHSDGRPTGMAFIEFETPQEAVKAMVCPFSQLLPLDFHGLCVYSPAVCRSMLGIC
jgi:RNA recognition motif-containing protein